MSKPNIGYTGFLESYLRGSSSLEKLRKLRGSMNKQRRHSMVDAISDGIFALSCEVEQDLDMLIKRGQLLYAFEGTKALEGGAA